MTFGSFRPDAPGKRGEREAVVNAAQKQREERERHRKKARAAVTIQSACRRHLAALSTAAAARSRWDADFGPAAAAKGGGPPDAVGVQTRLLPPLLHTLLPRGGGDGGLSLGPTDPPRLRGALGVLLGSFGEVGEKNWLALCSQGATWRQQCRRLVRLCALALEATLAGPPEGGAGRRGGGGGADVRGDKLLQAGSARVLAVLSDTALWKCYPTGAPLPPAAAEAHAAVVASLAGCAPLYRALRAALLATPPAGSAPETGGGGSTAPPPASVVSSLLTLGLRGVDGPAAAGPAAAARAGAALVSHAMTVPRLAARLPPPALALLLRPPTLRALLRALGVPLGKSCSVGGAAPLASRPGWLGLAATWALANSITLASSPGLPPAVWAERGMAADYAGALGCLLGGDLSVPPARKGAGGGGGGGEGKGWKGCREDALEALAPLSSRAHMLRLFRNSQGDGVGAVALAYAGVLRLLPRLMAVESTAEGVAVATAPVLNALAFAPEVLHALWGWLARALRVPGEVPQAVADVAGPGVWDVESLRGGVMGAGVPEHGASVMGIFCRAYGSLLMVLDDDDFFERQEPFKLEQQRAIAAALNTLVYHTHCPPANAPPGPAGRAPVTPAREALAAAAPGALKALYERNTRREFCPPALWLAPAGATPLPPAAEIAGALRVELDARAGGGGGGAGGAAGAAARALLAVPHVVPFRARVEVFQALVHEERRRAGLHLTRAQGGPRPTSFEVRRGMEMDCAFSALAGPRGTKAIRGPLDISFINQQGLEEAGLDYGGLMKEFLVETTRAGFNPGYSLFEAGVGGLLRPAPSAQHLPDGLLLLELMGRLVGRCMYEEVLLEVAFAPFFVTRILGRHSYLDELPGLDPEVHRSLVQVKRYEGDAADLCLDFTVEDEVFGEVVQHELRPGGADIPVTDDNKLQYVHLVADWRLNRSMHAVASAFIGGLTQVIPATWLRLFNPSEFNQLLSGGHVDVDVEDLKRHVRYTGGYSADSRSVKLFWEVVGKFSQEDRGALLKFVTTCARPPLLGFKHMNPALTIHKVDCESSIFAIVGGKDAERLPSASTCFNTLKLPNYKRASTMREKLLYAVHAAAGFELS